MKILFAEDDELVRRYAVRCLELAGIEVEIATNGYEAKFALENHGPFDLVLLDMLMPAMDGWELLRLKTQMPEPARSTPVLVWTVVGACNGRLRGLRGVAGIIEKPSSPAELIEAVTDFSGVRIQKA